MILRRWVPAAAAALAALSTGFPALAGSPLPFTPAFRARVEEAFFEDGALSARKLERFRAGLERRRDETVEVFAAEQRARGRKARGARRRALRAKEVRIYDALLGGPGGPGWLEELAGEADPDRARRRAGRILELEHALRQAGDRPASLRLPENMAAISVLPWHVPGRPRAGRAEREASNLWNPRTGDFFDPAELAALIRRGEDVSRLGPPPDSSFWRDPGPIASVDVRRAYLGGDHGLDPAPRRGRLAGIRKTQTKPKFEVEVGAGDAEREYKLKVGGEVHSEPTAGALLAALGFHTDVVVHVEEFRIDLEGVGADEVRREWRSYFEFKRVHLSYRFDDYFRIGEDDGGSFLVARRASLAAKPPELVRVGPWPFGSLGNEGLREVRALGIFSVWIGNTDLKEADNNKLALRPGPDGEWQVLHLLHDPGHAFGRVLSEQLDAFPWDLVRRTPDGRILFNYHSTWNPSLRGSITWADARWMVRLIAQLRREQIAEAVALGAWPDSAGRLLLEKLVHRRNQLVEAFGLEGEPTPSGPIALLPVARRLRTADGEVVGGELVDGLFQGATQDFDSYWPELLGPVWERAKLVGVGVFQRSVGLIPALIFDRDSVGLPKYAVLDLLVTLKREVEENPNPTGSDDYYLVRDRFLLGLRLGGGLVATGTTALWRSYTLVQPAGTLEEAHFAGDTILDVRLPFQVWQGRLPEDFVLIRESYLDARANLTTTSLAGSVPPVGASGSAGWVRLRRDVVSRRGGRTLAYEDRSSFAEGRVESWLNLVFVRIPFGHLEARDGALEGRAFELPPEALGGDPRWSEALSRLLRDGDFAGIEGRVAERPLRSEFRSELGWVALPYFLRRSRLERWDRIDAGPGARQTQVRRTQGGFWAFLDWGEDFLHTVSAVAPQGGPGPRIVSTWFQRDRRTFDDELGDSYIGFVNGIAAAHGPLIAFTPSLHSSNGRWGDLETGIRVGYSRKGVRRLREIRADELWERLRLRLGLEPAELEGLRRRLATRGKLGWGRRQAIPPRLRLPLRAAERVLASLSRARAEDDPERWMGHVVEALARASIRRAGGFDPVLLGALHDALEPKQFSIEVAIAPPPWVENRLPGEAALGASTHKKRHRLERPFMDFDPQCTAAWVDMLQGLVGEDPLADRFGAACDGARGSFR